MCIFCQIIQKKVPTKFIFENDFVVAFSDINPKAPVHALIVPKKHVRSVNDLSENDATDIVQIMLAAKAVAQKLYVAKGYKLAFNVERAGGQVIDHVHMHLLAWPDDRTIGDEPEEKEVAMV